MAFSNLFLLFAQSHFSRLSLARSLALPVVKSRHKVRGSSIIWTNIVTQRPATVMRWRQIDRDKLDAANDIFRHAFVILSSLLSSYGCGCISVKEKGSSNLCVEGNRS